MKWDYKGNMKSASELEKASRERMWSPWPKSTKCWAKAGSGNNINLVALASNMSNKILMNSKIKKSFFHLLLIRELFFIPTWRPQRIQKIGQQTGQWSSPLQSYPMILSSPSQAPWSTCLVCSLKDCPDSKTFKETGGFRDARRPTTKAKSFSTTRRSSLKNNQNKKTSAQKKSTNTTSPKIIAALNSFQREPTELFDRLEDLKNIISQRERRTQEQISTTSLCTRMELLWHHRHQQLLRLQKKQTKTHILTTQSVDPRVQGKVHQPQRVSRPVRLRGGTSVLTYCTDFPSPLISVYITNFSL